MSQQNPMDKINNPKFTQNYTYVESESMYNYNAPHAFNVRKSENDVVVCHVHFQEGPIKEVGVNGVNNEDLLLMVITRLESFQNSEYKCDANQAALDHLYGAIDALRSRTNERKKKRR